MRKLARLLAGLALLTGAASLVPTPRRFICGPDRPPCPRESLAALLALDMLKALVVVFAPFVAFTGALGALLGLACRDNLSLFGGLLGSALALRQLHLSTRPHSEFERAFGPQVPAAASPRWRLRAPHPPPARVEADLLFGTHHETGDPLLCDLWRPAPGVAPSGLGVIYLHGSGWHLLDKDFGTRRFFAQLAARGHVIMDVAYIMAPRADMQGMLNDVRRAIAWLRQHGPAYGVRPDRIVLAGGSAGAHLSLLAAYTADHPGLRTPDVQGDPSVCGVVSFYGVADLAAFYNQMGHLTGEPLSRRPWLDRLEARLRRVRFVPPYGSLVPMQQFISGPLGGSPAEQPEAYHLYSPLAHVGPGCPPTLILQGSADLGVIAEHQGRPLARALHRAGTPVVYVEFPGSEHGFDLILPAWSPAAQASLSDVERFLAALE